jgi:hypothetical protein
MKLLPRDPCEHAESIRDALLGDECEQGSSSLMARAVRTDLFVPPADVPGHDLHIQIATTPVT